MGGGEGVDGTQARNELRHAGQMVALPAIQLPWAIKERLNLSLSVIRKH